MIGHTKYTMGMLSGTEVPLPGPSSLNFGGGGAWEKFPVSRWLCCLTCRRPPFCLGAHPPPRPFSERRRKRRFLPRRKRRGAFSRQSPAVEAAAPPPLGFKAD